MQSSVTNNVDHLDYLVGQLQGKNIVDIEKFMKEHYDCRVNKALPLFCPMYHHIKTDFSKMGALATRGTVFALNEDGIFDGQVVCVPFFKFFNHGEKLAYDAPDDQIVSIQRKYDGSLTKVFKFNSEWIVGSNGTPSAAVEFVKLFEKALGLPREKFGDILDEDKVYIFELCTPENKVVVSYDDYYAKLLMVRCNKTWTELDNGEDVEGHYEVVREVDAFDPKEVGEEGVVVLYKGGYRVKRKTNWYRTLHKGFKGSGFNGMDLGMIQRAIHGGFYDDVLVLCPEASRKHAELYKAQMVKYEKAIGDTLSAIPGVTGLEKQEDKENLVEQLKARVFEEKFQNSQERNRVLNVLFGKSEDLFVGLEKGGKNNQSMRNLILKA